MPEYAAAKEAVSTPRRSLFTWTHEGMRHSSAPGTPPRRLRHPVSTANGVEAQSRRIDRALRRTNAYPHRVGHVRRIETHISIVYLAGAFAYKRCKPVNFGFVDFTRLEARYRACLDSLRLNRRLARALYIGVVEIDGNAHACRIVSRRATMRKGPRMDRMIDYALKMRRFRQSDLLSARVARGLPCRDEIDRAAERIAAFHRRALPLRADARFGSAAAVRAQLNDVIGALEREAPGWLPANVARAAHMQATALADHIEHRRTGGFVRECHGDLHLDNIVRRGRDIAVFDCIEFSDTLRRIDVTADLAFLAMDLLAHGRGDLATRFVDRWLLETGDYAGVRALSFYVVYRALVRSLVSILKNGVDGRMQAIPAAAKHYLQLAEDLTIPRSRFLVLCHGFSGSGKSFAAAALAPHLGAILVSSDIERKRSPSPFATRSRSALPTAAYASGALDANYLRLAALADELLRSGLPVVVDASFLKRAHRTQFIELAKRHGIPVWIADIHAPYSELVERLRARALHRGESSDADVAVLHRQMVEAQPLDASESTIRVSIDGSAPRATVQTAAFWQPLLARLVGARGWLAGRTPPNAT
jgi:aminoglycoside phosphotransferase family enzyme/predicted kinase